MRSLLTFALVCILSIATYLAIFMGIVQKPVTLGFIDQMIKTKQNYGQQLQSPKVVIVAGSTGLFSFRCEAIAATLGKPCVNASLTTALGLRMILEKAKQIIKPGDTVLMPLEFYSYFKDHDPKLEYPFMVLYDTQMLSELEFVPSVKALFSQGFQEMMTGFIEVGAVKAGVPVLFGPDSLNSQGDLQGHTKAKAVDFQQGVMSARMEIPSFAQLAKPGNNRQLLDAFLSHAKANNIKIIGMMPVTVDGHRLPGGMEKRIAEIFTEAGHRFLFRERAGQYSLDCFYDSPYHLHEECQIENSRKLAREINSFL